MLISIRSQSEFDLPLPIVKKETSAHFSQEEDS